ncbi:energy transducer TonB [Xanthomonas campestris]|uniref:energy transducer TonB n=3 Tax=Xanthomonas campestris TaxID=339 RepID=UPI000C1F83B6|nr:energy transducer TonB [Xanthomonas campestris]MEB1633788.1 energy transducer TonB [Xanthomonas campestris pv. campestris]WDI87366.1 energy transducer TonB [Xanthomonas campestris pv. campestris]WDJ05961.1 energy transducer TonB [Xanthomonas campestris pv. incanae]WDL17574.1 energy transducer TonB [Xanthomonas campestris pv. campestris]WDL21656.1 energy transducer TonB [Xanthomonas campestris pv. campestris]
MLDLTQGRMARRIAPVILLVGLAACSKQEEKPAATAGTTPAAPATAPAPTAATAVSPQVQSMAADQLRESATKALQDNRMYAPAGDNAVEYYLALREKQPQDATVNSALTDLMPYTLIAAEQGISREEFPEAQRLIALIEKVDPRAPALPRLKSGLEAGMKTAANRTEQDAEQAKKLVEDKAKQAAEQKRLAEQQSREAAAAQQIAAQQETARQQAAEAERQAAAKRPAEPAPTPAAPRPAPAAAAAAPAAASLRPISTPAPRYPPEALRAGTSGEVLVEITVGTDGSITASRVLRASPPRVFDREALNAVKRWRFEPVAAPVTTRRTLSFNPGG